jgi:hypothetical protein
MALGWMGSTRLRRVLDHSASTRNSLVSGLPFHAGPISEIRLEWTEPKKTAEHQPRKDVGFVLIGSLSEKVSGGFA